MSLDGELVPLSRIADYLPSSLHGLHKSTVIRWALKGVGKPRTRLKTVKIGGRRYVTRPAVAEFVHRLSNVHEVKEAKQERRNTELQRAEAELDADGI